MEFLDFYKESGTEPLKFLVFDSKFTTYENLSKLDDRGVKFLTIRRRGKNVVEEIENMPKSELKVIRIPASDCKCRTLTIIERKIELREYGKEIRQIAIVGKGRIKPALIITNDFQLKTNEIVRKYAKRWLVEKTISEEIEFFHLNKVSSSMVIKVDFDLTMTVLAFNLYRLFAQELEGYQSSTSIKLYEKFIYNSADIKIEPKQIIVSLKKKRNLPAILSAMETYKKCIITWMHNRKLVFAGASRS